jgi:uncharacterized membrane protein
MQPMTLGNILFACGLAGLGFLSLASGDFALNWQPVPEWVPWRENLAHASGFVLLAGGTGMLLRPTARVSTGVVAFYVLLWLLLLHLPRIVARPANGVGWLGFAEIVTLLAGGSILLTSAAAMQDHQPDVRVVRVDRGVRFARFIYGAALPIIGLSHFLYIEATTALVPAWLPYRMALAYLTGAVQIAAGVGLVLTIRPRLAATLEALLITSFTLLVWVPRVVVAPATRPPWTALFISSAIAGAAWVVADSFPSPGDSTGSNVRRMAVADNRVSNRAQMLSLS